MKLLKGKLCVNEEKDKNCVRDDNSAAAAADDDVSTTAIWQRSIVTGQLGTVISFCHSIHSLIEFRAGALV